MASDKLSLFTGIGLSEQKAKETIKNEAISKNLEEVIKDVSIGEVSRFSAHYELLYCRLFSKIRPRVLHHSEVLQYIQWQDLTVSGWSVRCPV